MLEDAIHNSTNACGQPAGSLGESEQKYQCIVENSHDLIMITLPDGIISYLSPACRRITGYEPEELVGKASRIEHPDDEPFASRHFQHALRGNSGSDIEYRIITKQQTIRWVSHSWSSVYHEDTLRMIISVIRDITESKKAQEAIRRSENRLRTLIANVPGAVYRTLLDRDWTMQFLSDAIEDLCGYPASDFVNNARRTYAGVIHPDDREFVWESVRDDVEARRPFAIEYRVIHADGGIKWVIDKGQAVFSDDDELLSLDGVIFDITARKTAEEDLRKAHEDLSRAYDIQREFLNNVTHEIRTPLTAVQGYAEMLLEQVAGPINDEQSALLGKVMSSSKHLLNMVSGVLEIARLKSGTIQLRPKACNPCQIMEEAISAITPQASRKGLTISAAMPQEKPLGMYDEHKLTMILTNLLTNAIKFTERGGVEISVSCDQWGTEVIICDSGLGIRQSDMESIFDEFTQFDQPKKHKPSGFGIGLAIVATMVETVGGSLTVSSRRGVGTAFTLRAPRLDGRH